MSVPAQIAVLLALTAKLFDPVPLEEMPEAERAVQEAAAAMPAELSARLTTAAELNDDDRKAITAIAGQALAPFHPPPEPRGVSERASAKDTP